MSLRGLPIIFFNMSGELLFILEERLREQRISEDIAQKALQTIISTVFHEKIIGEIMRPQPLANHEALRDIFENLVHVSSIRLRETSTDKLYDLMTMMVKYQIQNCECPKHLLSLTINHIDAIRQMLKNTHPMQKRISQVFDQLLAAFDSMNQSELQFLRTSLLQFFSKIQLKVVILLQEKVQLPSGRFVVPSEDVDLAWGCKTPVSITFYKRGEQTNAITCETPTTYTEASQKWNLLNDGLITTPPFRGTKFGENLFRKRILAIRGGLGSAYGRRKLPVVPSEFLNNEKDSDSKLGTGELLAVKAVKTSSDWQYSMVNNGSLYGASKNGNFGGMAVAPPTYATSRAEINLMRHLLASQSKQRQLDGTLEDENNLRISLFDGDRDENEFVTEALNAQILEAQKMSNSKNANNFTKSPKNKSQFGMHFGGAETLSHANFLANDNTGTSSSGHSSSQNSSKTTPNHDENPSQKRQSSNNIVSNSITSSDQSKSMGGFRLKPITRLPKIDSRSSKTNIVRTSANGSKIVQDDDLQEVSRAVSRLKIL